MAKTWANEASGLRASDNHARRVPPPPSTTDPRPASGPAGARYRPDFSVGGDRVDFDRVMLESWRPKAVRPQTDPFYVPGPGSEPPPLEMDELIPVEPVSRPRVLLLGAASLAALLVVSAGAYLLGRSVGQGTEPSVATAETPAVAETVARRPARVEVGAVTVEPLPGSSAPVLAAPPRPVTVEPASEEPRIRPLAVPEAVEQDAVEADRRRAREQRRRAARRARAERTARAEPAMPAPASAASEPEDEPAWQAPPLAAWDDVVASSGGG